MPVRTRSSTSWPSSRTTCPVKPKSRSALLVNLLGKPPRSWQDEPWAALVYPHATGHFTWAQLCTSIARIAAAPARINDEVSSLALHFLNMLAQSAEGCDAPALLNLIAHVRTLLPLVMKTAYQECSSLPADWILPLCSLVRSIAVLGPHVLCPNAAFANVLLQLLDKRGDDAIFIDEEAPLTLTECALDSLWLLDCDDGMDI